MQPRVSKSVLANIIRHVDTHNRIVEEEECWKQRKTELGLANKSSQSKTRSYETSPERSYRSCRSNSNDVKSAHMDCADDVQPCSYDGREEKTGTYWMRQLDKAESALSDRWGHSGYKELYPHDFVSDRDSSDDDITKRKECRKSQSSRKKSKKKKKEASSDAVTRNHKSKKRQRRHSESDSDSQSKHRKKKRHKKKKRKKD